MRHIVGETVVISLGGSAVCPESVDTQFVKNFATLIAAFAKKGRKFVLIVGGGRICRTYQKAAEEIAKVPDKDLDWIGIYATRLNAMLVCTAFGKLAVPELIERRGQVRKLTKPITISGGWFPGNSTDYVTTALAHDFGAKEVINVGKPRFVYDKNPDEYPEARAFREMSWKQYRVQSPKKWTPGFHAPVDPIAARFAEKDKLTMFVVGTDLKNLAALLKGEEFEGTIIS